MMPCILYNLVLDEYLNGFFEEFLLLVITTIGTTIIAYFRSMRNKQITNTLVLNKLSQKSWKIEKSILLLAKLIAKQTKQSHPEIDTSSLEEVVKELMRDEK